MNFNADPNWKEHYEEKKKYEVWSLFFAIKIYAACVLGVAAFYLMMMLIVHLQQKRIYDQTITLRAVEAWSDGSDMGPFRLKS